MYYLSRHEEGVFYVTDTDDNITEPLSEGDILKLHDKKVTIYGVDIYNRRAKCMPIKVNIACNAQILRTLLESWKELHNPWTGIPVRDYLAACKVGTSITVDYSFRGDGDRRIHNCVMKLRRLDWDTWSVQDSESAFDGDTGDTSWAAGMLEVSCIYSNSYKLTAK